MFARVLHGRVPHGRVLHAEITDELRGILREPTALFFSVVMPVAFFALFVSIFGDYSNGRVSSATLMTANFGTFGVLAVTLVTPGVGVARDREIGWLRAKRVSAVPVGVTLMAKVAAALPYALTVLAAMTVTAAFTGSLQAPALRLLAVGGILLLGCLPFALLSVAIGLRAGTNTTVATLQAILMPAAVLSGLWMPLSTLPEFIGDLARFLPTYHLAQLAVSQVDPAQASDTALHLGVLVATACVFAALAVMSYRRAGP